MIEEGPPPARQLDAFPETVNSSAPPEEENDSRFTLPAVDAQCKKLARVRKWTLDVAACKECHLAPKYYTREDNGLVKRWHGFVWCNPPWSLILPWVVKAWEVWRARPREVKVIGMLLPATRTDLDWWQEQVEPYRDRPGQPLRTRFLGSRLKYGKPGDRYALTQGQPEFGSVFLWWSRQKVKASASYTEQVLDGLEDFVTSRGVRVEYLGQPAQQGGEWWACSVEGKVGALLVKWGWLDEEAFWEVHHTGAPPVLTYAKAEDALRAAGDAALARAAAVRLVGR